MRIKRPRMAKSKKKTSLPTGNVPTNYAYTTIDGVAYTFLVQPDGSGIIQSPIDFKGLLVRKSSTGWVLV
jgi:hypothetical protein